MAVTVANLITNLDTYISDTTTDRVSQAERLQALTEAAAWIIEETGNDHTVKTYELDYLDTINYYKITSSVADLLTSADLRREEANHIETALHLSSRDMAQRVGIGSNDFAWSIDRRNNDVYLVITASPENAAKTVASFDSTTADGGTWTADTTNSDATNVTADSIEYKKGSGSLNFDVDVSQSANNKATIYNSSLSTIDMSDYEDVASFIFEAYIPDTTNFTSFTLYWGSDASNYWSVTATTDIDGASFSDGWNTIKVDWEDATQTSSPDVDNIDYIKIDLNYAAGQGDDTDFRLDNLRVVQPETLTFFYNSWNVGASNAGAELKAYTATNDVPFYSGKYDQYKYAHAHKAASILLFTLRLRDEALVEEREAQRQIERIKDIVPSSQIKETHSFKVYGVNFSRRRR